MAKFVIATDSTVYSSKNLIEFHNIRVIPLNIPWDDVTFKEEQR